MSGLSIEDVRGRLGGELEPEVAAFLERAGSTRDLADVICVLTGADGRVAGVSAVTRGDVRLVGGRPFWLYEGLLTASVAGESPRLLNATFESLASQFDPADVSESGPGSPIGICVLAGDPSEFAGSDHAVWPETGLVLAARLDGGRELRVRYFEGAPIGPGVPEAPSFEKTAEATHDVEGYRLVPFEESELSADDVVAFWAREGAMPQEEANRRVAEVHQVALDREGGIAAVATIYLRANEQLRGEFWHYRAFVGRAHRKSAVAWNIAKNGLDLLDRRYADGSDTRAPGMIFEMENPGIKRYFNKARWPQLGMWFIGENDHGDHVRIRWFEGARVPPPHG